MLLDKSPDTLNALFDRVFTRDIDQFGLEDYIGRWLYAERVVKKGKMTDMGFDSYEGPAQLRKFLSWGPARPDTFEHGLADDLTNASIAADRRVFRHYSLHASDAALLTMGRYNAQDYLHTHAYHMPSRCDVKVMLDFGPGHGRLANLAFNTPIERDRVDCYIAVEGIPSTYFVQAAYFAGLGLSVWDYFDHYDTPLSQDTIAAAMRDYQVVHLPTWRYDLIPDDVIDLIACVQVLPELPGRLVNLILPEFKRICQRHGAVYIRDHKQFHIPNQMPVEMLLQAQGFGMEYAPFLQDRVDLHGLPRIWRKIDPDQFLRHEKTLGPE